MRLIALIGLAVVLRIGYAQAPDQPLTERERMLLDRVEKLEQRIAALEAQAAPVHVVPVPAHAPEPAPNPSLPGVLAGTTFNVNFDGYYGYNFNNPVGRVNLLRANDVTSNSFTLGQADLVIERAADPSAGRRLGVRIDLMFGQNTETLQGSALNEPRPQVYRNIFQAYGTYVAPVGSGLTVDFGKFASSLGFENNYTKDQINYSRSYYFNFLPFYHMGFRSTYKFNDKFTFQYWLVNGANQTEGFNGFKSNAFLLALNPTKTLSWNVNYFFGQQGRDLVPDLTTQPGLSIQPVVPRPDGREHIFDTYGTWTPNSKVQLGLEADYVVNRNYANSSPARVTGAVGYLKYQFQPKLFVGSRFEYLSDRGGLFTGKTQALKDGTATLTYQPVDGFQMRWEYRRDYSNLPFFLSHTPGLLRKQQDTALLGLIWWFGGKQGAW